MTTRRVACVLPFLLVVGCSDDSIPQSSVEDVAYRPLRSQRPIGDVLDAGLWNRIVGATDDEQKRENARNTSRGHTCPPRDGVLRTERSRRLRNASRIQDGALIHAYFVQVAAGEVDPLSLIHI